MIYEKTPTKNQTPNTLVFSQEANKLTTKESIIEKQSRIWTMNRNQETHGLGGSALDWGAYMRYGSSSKAYSQWIKIKRLH